MRDLDRALYLVDSLSPQSDFMWFAAVPGMPLGHCNSSGNRSDLKSHLVGVPGAPLSGNLALGCVFFRPNKQRIDVDNMLKYVNDAATGVLWHDDSQVTAVMGVAELDVNSPRTLVVLARHSSSLLRERGSSIQCLQCGSSFVAKSSKPQQLCSTKCQIESMRGRNRISRIHEWLPCISCGKMTSKPRVIRCRECWKNRFKRYPNEGIGALPSPGVRIQIAPL